MFILDTSHWPSFHLSSAFFASSSLFMFSLTLRLFKLSLYIYRTISTTTNVPLFISRTISDRKPSLWILLYLQDDLWQNKRCLRIPCSMICSSIYTSRMMYARTTFLGLSLGVSLWSKSLCVFLQTIYARKTAIYVSLVWSIIYIVLKRKYKYNLQA